MGTALARALPNSRLGALEAFGAVQGIKDTAGESILQEK